MDDLKYTTASNIINLRQKAGMTQSELAGLINYSDKSVSKWERAEAVPDAYVLKKMSEIFGVTVDYLLSPHDGWDQDPRQKKPLYSNQVIILLSVTGVWMLALILFITLWMLKSGMDHFYLCHSFLHAGAAGAQLRSGAGEAQLSDHRRADSFHRSVAVLLFPVFRKAELLAAVPAAGPGLAGGFSDLPPAEAA